jgi:hypothetical protein
MDNQKSKLTQEEQQQEFYRRIREVMNGAPDGLDEESLKAGVVLLHED